MYQKKSNPRIECRQKENLRLQASASLSDTFGELKSLIVELEQFRPGGRTKTSEVKYTVNVEKAKSLFRIDCPNEECVAGDFDLSENLANAIKAHHESTSGELICNGWHNKADIDRVRCNHVLRYKMSVGFRSRHRTAEKQVADSLKGA